MYRFPGQKGIDSERLETIADLPGPLLAGPELFADLSPRPMLRPKLEHRRPSLSPEWFHQRQQRIDELEP